MKTQIRFENSEYRVYQGNDTEHFSPIENSDLLKAEIEEIRKYSITPTTFDSRSFFNQSTADRIRETIEKVTINKTDLENRLNGFINYEQELLAHLKNISTGIIEEGEFTKINIDLLGLSEKFIPKITALDNYLIELELYRNFVLENQDLDLSYYDIYNNSANEVTRFGINTAIMNQHQTKELAEIYTTSVNKKGSVKSGTKSSKSQKDSEVLKPLHPIEVFLIQDAINFLKTSESKSVLVDIFVRNDDGRISIKDNKLDIHTVVLYCNREIGKIIVIDPSNPDFSKHIATNSVRLFRESEGNFEITIPPIQKIYVPFNKDNVGPGPDQYRDCIDLSAKIAFGLNKLNGYINTQDIMSSSVIQEITNQEQSNKSLFFSSDEAIARIRQASDDNIRAKFQELLLSFDKLTKATDCYSKSESLEIQKNNITLFSQCYLPNQYDECINSLSNRYSENAKVLKEAIDKEISGLLGEVNQEL